MDRSTRADDDSTETQTQTLRDVYGAIDLADVESREDYDPALLPDGAVPEEAPDGRDYHTAAWDGGVSDLEAADGPYTTEEGAPAVLVYVSNQGGVQVHEGEVVTCSGRVVTVEADDGTLRTAHSADMAGRHEAVHNHAGADSRHIGTMLEVRLVESWDDYERRMELLADARDDDGDDDQDDDGDDGDDGEVRTDGGRDAVTADDLELSERHARGVRTRHAFRADEPRAACGHRSTERHERVDAPDATWRAIECENCQRALASRYRSLSDDWEAVRALEEDDVVHVYTDDGESFEAVVTSAADDLEAGDLGTLYVRLTTNPGRVSYQRDTEDDYRLVCAEGDAPTVTNADLLEQLDENPERPVTALEVVGTHDYRADEDPEHREAVMHAAEQVAALHDRWADETGSSEEHLWNVNYASAVRDVAYRLRSDGWPLAWVRQKVESKADAYRGYPEEVHQDDEADRDDYAKARGKAAGYEAALNLLDDLAPEGDDSDDDTEDDDEEDRLRADGGTERTTPVDGGVIHDVAMSYTFGAGHLKAVLERVGPDGDLTTDSLADEDAKTAEAARKALELHGEHEAIDLRDDLEGETFYSDEFAAPVEVSKVHDPHADDVLRDVWPIEVVKPNGAAETTSVDTLVTERPEPDALETGDLVRLPDGTALHVQGVAPAEEAPESADGPLYQAVLRRPDASTETHLYGPHNIRYALAGGAVYAGWASVEERTPFWCDGCQHPHRAEERRDDPLVDGVTCSYGCARTVTQDRLAERLERDDR